MASLPLLPASTLRRATSSQRARPSSGDGAGADDCEIGRKGGDEGGGPRGAWRRGAAAGAGAALAAVALVALAAAAATSVRTELMPITVAHPAEARAGPGWLPPASAPGASARGAASRSRRPPILISYAYFEKDAIQASNLAYFAAVGMGAGAGAAPPDGADFVVAVAGPACTPCASFAAHLAPDTRGEAVEGLAAAWSGPGFGRAARPGTVALLHRAANAGMDFASHAASLAFVAAGGKGALRRYAHYIFVNSSARGPFFPAYMPAAWAWPDAFTDRLVGKVRLAASSLVCLPAADVGGPGPRAESWAFALDPVGLAVATDAGVFGDHGCKLCAGGVVLAGEYGLSSALLAAGHSVATLMARYSPAVDWADPRHWACNDGAHPSRAGTYDGISMHPFETLFVKASWHVGQPYTDAYARWGLALAGGGAGTEGRFDETAYRFAISAAAQGPRSDACAGRSLNWTRIGG